MADKLIKEILRKKDFLSKDFTISCINHAIEILNEHEYNAGNYGNYSILDDRLYEYQLQNGIYSEDEEIAIEDSLSTRETELPDYLSQDIGYEIVNTILEDVKEKLLAELKAENKQF